MAGSGGGGWGGYDDDDDDWGLTAEQLDQIERDAIRQLAERKASSAAASTSPAPALANASPLPSRAPVPATAASSPLVGNHPAARASLEARFGKVELPSPSRLCDPNMFRNAVNNSQNSSSKISVHLSLHSSGVIAAKFPYNQLLVNAFHNIPKACWNAKERVWMFPASCLSIAEEVLHTVPGLTVEVHKLDPLVQRALVAASCAKDLQDLYDRIPADVESKLMPFQREGVRFVLQHGGRALIADEMGLGKTLQALAVASCLRDAWPVLVITPSALRLHWASMIQNWLNIPTEDILVVIADESHFMKNSQAKRTIASLPVLQKAPYVVLLSGTPALSRPIELFTQLQALYPTVYKNVNEYGNRYCRGGFFGLYQGASNHEELHTLMKATVMIRRLKKDVLSQLPVKHRQQVFLDLSESEMKPIRALSRELEALKIKIQSADSKEMVDSLKLTQKNLISKMYTDSAVAKIPAVLDYLATVIEADCKFLIFAHHLPLINAIEQYLLKKKVKCIRIDGQTPATTRQTLVTDFQNRDDIKAAVLSIKAGGVGLTLTAASTVIFAELSWTPGDLIQAEDRAHRIGQMLDGQEKTLDVSRIEGRPSPSKQQKTLDGYLKRCSDSREGQPHTKQPRF